MPYSRFKSGAPSLYTPPAPRADHRTIARRGIEAAIWGLPLVQVEAIRRAFFNAGAQYGDIVFCSQPVSWKLQMPTPDTSFLYAYFVFNLAGGPMVLDVPACSGMQMAGSVVDAWEKHLLELGPLGTSAGEAARYLLLPPNYEKGAPEGLVPIQVDTFNGYGYFRVPVSQAVPAIAELAERFGIYRLSQLADPPPQNAIDISDITFDGVLRFDEQLYDSLARIVAEEPVQARDFVAMGQLRSIGIIKGQPFVPDSATRNVLRHAAAEAHGHLMRGVAAGQAYWPHTQWIRSTSNGHGTSNSYIQDDRLELDERGIAFFLAHAPAPKANKAIFSVGAFSDVKGLSLDGGKQYVLRVPAAVPSTQSWAISVYDLETATFIRDASQLAIYGDDPALVHNEDGSVDIAFAPSAPAENAANWIRTVHDRHWFVIARLYGPTQPALDKSWGLPNIEPVA